MKTVLTLATAATLLAGSARADSLEPAPAPAAPRLFATVFAGTTLASRAGGVSSGPSRDLSPMVGVGYLLSEAWALELDVGPTFLPGQGYSGFSLVPGVVWSFSKHFYAAGRVAVPVHPAPGLVLSPGVGGLVPFDNGLAPFAELNALVWHGETGVGVGGLASVGVLFFF